MNQMTPTIPATARVTGTVSSLPSMAAEASQAPTARVQPNAIAARTRRGTGGTCWWCRTQTEAGRR